MSISTISFTSQKLVLRPVGLNIRRISALRQFHCSLPSFSNSLLLPTLPNLLVHTIADFLPVVQAIDFSVHIRGGSCPNKSGNSCLEICTQISSS